MTKIYKRKYFEIWLNIDLKSILTSFTISSCIWELDISNNVQLSIRAVFIGRIL